MAITFGRPSIDKIDLPPGWVLVHDTLMDQSGPTRPWGAMKQAIGEPLHALVRRSMWSDIAEQSTPYRDGWMESGA